MNRSARVFLFATVLVLRAQALHAGTIYEAPLHIAMPGGGQSLMGALYLNVSPDNTEYQLWTRDVRDSILEINTGDQSISIVPEFVGEFTIQCYDRLRNPYAEFDPPSTIGACLSFSIWDVYAGVVDGPLLASVIAEGATVSIPSTFNSNAVVTEGVFYSVPESSITNRLRALLVVAFAMRSRRIFRRAASEPSTQRA